MGSLYTFLPTNSFSRDMLNLEHGTAKNIHYGDIHTKLPPLVDTSRERIPFINEGVALPAPEAAAYCREGDLVFADASEDLDDVGKCVEVVRLNGDMLLSGQHTILARRVTPTLVVGFGGHLFRSERIRSQVRMEAQGTKVFGLSPSRLARIAVAYPVNRGEQQQIADCLSSLDDAITAQARQVEALKAHKRGLMQQLFPRDGETVPRLRFPEFRDAPEWMERALGTVCESVASGRDKPDSNGAFELYGSTGVIGRTDTATYNGRYLLVARVGANAGLLTDARGQFGVTDNTIVIALMDPASTDFILFYLQSVGLNRMIYGSGQPLITGTQLRNLALYLPEEAERQRVAGVLASLDAQVRAASEKLISLRSHKAGLMQQLFPSPDVD